MLVAALVATVLSPDRAEAQGETIQAEAQTNSCFRCHRVIDEERYAAPVRDYVEDVHYRAGFGCVVCHGGDSRVLDRTRAKDPNAGYIGIPDREEIPELCARCHSDVEFMRHYVPDIRTDQLARYRTSVHGQRLFGVGDEKVAVCTSCHTAHSIRPPTDPSSSVHPPVVSETCGACHADSSYMAEYGIPTDQLDEYHESVHYMMMEEGDLSAPTCNDCHGNHGATPPDVEWIGAVCGQCHSAEQDMFEVSGHPEAFVSLGRPGCAGCHDNHAVHPVDDSMLGLGEKSFCGECHDPAEPEGEATLAMANLIEKLKLERHESDSLLEAAEDAGLEVSQPMFVLEDATNALVRARTATHTADVDSVRARVEEGLEVTSTAWEEGEAAFRDLRIRRLGLAVSSGIIVLLIIGLVVKIREHDSAAPPTETMEEVRNHEPEREEEHG